MDLALNALPVRDGMPRHRHVDPGKRVGPVRFGAEGSATSRNRLRVPPARLARECAITRNRKKRGFRYGDELEVDGDRITQAEFSRALEAHQVRTGLGGNFFVELGSSAVHARSRKSEHLRLAYTDAQCRSEIAR